MNHHVICKSHHFGTLLRSLSISVGTLGLLLCICCLAYPVQAGERIAHMLTDSGRAACFLLSLDQDLYRFCPDDPRPQLQGQLPARPFGADLDSKGQLIAATDRGIFRPVANGEWEAVPGAPKGGAWVRCFPGAGCLSWVWGKGLHRIGADGLQELEQTGLPDSPVLDICQTSDGSLWAALFGPGVFRLRPGEDRWEPLNAGLSTRHVLAMSRDGRDRLYAGTFGGGLWVLPFGGRSWQPLPTLPATDITTVATGPDDRLILAGTRGQGLWLSTDQGRSWAGESEIAGTVSSLLWRTEDEAWAAEESGVLYRMQDDKWQEVDFGPGFVPRTAVIIQDGTVFLIQGRTLFRSNPQEGAGKP
ncbi:MAG: two-component regulator propeller domain-containing protein [Desulfovermiculus sp.]|nr:two-component regulator propeller domain-containing protein [Desulfovermiculus sp.]